MGLLGLDSGDNPGDQNSVAEIRILGIQLPGIESHRILHHVFGDISGESEY